MIYIDWTIGFPASIIITDKNAVVLYMNDKSISDFESDGGENLIGQSLFDCHNENSNEIIRTILETGIPNSYTITKKGKKKMIYQSPWLKDGEIAGLVELSFEIPVDLPNFDRD